MLSLPIDKLGKMFRCYAADHNILYSSLSLHVFVLWVYASLCYKVRLSCCKVSILNPVAYF